MEFYSVWNNNTGYRDFPWAMVFCSILAMVFDVGYSLLWGFLYPWDLSIRFSNKITFGLSASVLAVVKTMY